MSLPNDNRKIIYLTDPREAELNEGVLRGATHHHILKTMQAIYIDDYRYGGESFNGGNLYGAFGNALRADGVVLVDVRPLRHDSLLINSVEYILKDGGRPIAVVRIRNQQVCVDLTSKETMYASIKPHISEIAYAQLIHKDIDHRYVFDIILQHNVERIMHMFNVIKDDETAGFIRFYSEAINNDHFILHYTDSDYDGVSSALVAKNFYRYVSKHKNYGIVSNDRKHGNGINMHTIELIKEQLDQRNLPYNTTFTMVTSDHGSSNNNMIKPIKEIFPNIRILVTDHHNYHETPQFEAHVNNQGSSSCYPRSLSGAVMLGLVLIKAHNHMIGKTTRIQALRHMLTPMAVSMVSDRRSMICGYARALVKVIETSATPDDVPYHKLSDDSYDWGWNDVPPINSCGRMGQSNLALKLLLSEDLNAYNENFKVVKKINKTRKDITRKLGELFLSRGEVALQSKYKNVAIFVKTYDDIRHAGIEPTDASGIVGIIASQAADVIYRPCLVFIDDGEATVAGSGRKNVAGGFTFRDFTKIVRDYERRNKIKIIIKGGGHNEAAGFQIAREHFPLFCDMFDAYAARTDPDGYTKPSDYVMEVTTTMVNDRLYAEQRALGPFGTHFEIPKYKVTIKDDIEHDLKPYASFVRVKRSPKVTIVKWRALEQIDTDNIIAVLTRDTYNTGYSLTVQN